MTPVTPVTKVPVTIPNGPKVVVQQMPGWAVGWKTLVWGLLVAIVPAAWDWFSKVDWTQYVSPTWGMVIAGVGTIVFRVVTSGPILSNVTVKQV